MLLSSPLDHLPSNPFFSILLLGLSTWRVSSILVDEDGPMFVFRNMRELFGFKYSPDGEIIYEPSGSILACLWCLSVFISLAMMFLPLVINLIFAISATAILFHSIILRLTKDG